MESFGTWRESYRSVLEFPKLAELARIIVATRMSRTDLEKYLGPPSSAGEGSSIPYRSGRSYLIFSYYDSQGFSVELDRSGRAATATDLESGAGTFFAEKDDLEAMKRSPQQWETERVRSQNPSPHIRKP